MESIQRPVNSHNVYHAHVYFDAETVSFAQDLCTTAGTTFNLNIGRVNRKPVGPHTMWSCQILFTNSDFEQLIPWLDANRNGLSVLVHPDTGNDLSDHTTYAYWLGNPVALDVSRF